MNASPFTFPHLTLAFNKVRRNSDCAGVDGLTPTIYSLDIDSRLRGLENSLASGIYRPRPLRHIPVAPRNKKPRMLAVPTVVERIAQTVAAHTLSPIFEGRFGPSSFGYRPGRSVALALAHLVDHAEARPILVDADIRDFFGSVQHSRLDRLIDSWIPDRQLRELAHRWVAQHETRRGRGMALGSPLSPLFANMYLDELDHTLEHAGYAAVRYADDIVIACRDGVTRTRRCDSSAKRSATSDWS